MSNLRPLKCIFKYFLKSGLISGVGSQDIFRKNHVQKLCVKYCLAVLQSALLTLHPVRVSQQALHCHLQFLHVCFCVVLANPWVVFLSSAPARESVLHAVTAEVAVSVSCISHNSVGARLPSEFLVWYGNSWCGYCSLCSFQFAVFLSTSFFSPTS